MNLTPTFVEEIRQLIASARATVKKGVDLIQVHTNFEIGRRIVEQEQQGEDRAAYGKEIIKTLSERLTEDFGRGFSPSNLAYMRTFFLCYQHRAGFYRHCLENWSRGQKATRRLAYLPARFPEFCRQ